MHYRGHQEYFYKLLDSLIERLGGPRYLKNSHGRMKWPKRGLYFFFEHGERRSETKACRVVRVGTHALKEGAGTSLWERLRNHRGHLSGMRPRGGNRNGSIFRYHVGAALLHATGNRDLLTIWMSNKTDKKTRDMLHPVEVMVSEHIRSMPFVWLTVDDSPGPHSARAYLERNCIV